jgi:hypothetical protein
MSGGFLMLGGVANGNSAGAGTGAGTSVGTGASGYGSYVQLIASTPSDTSWFYLSCSNSTGNFVNQYAVTLGVGGAGSEVGLLTDLPAGYSNGSIISVPLCIPAGSRLAVKAYGDSGNSDTLRVSVILFDSSMVAEESFAGVESVITSTPYFSGNITTGTSGAYGSWVQLSSSTSKDYVGVLPVMAGSLGSTLDAGGVQFQLGIGAAGSEVILIPELFWPGGVWGSATSTLTSLMPVNIPAGTRVASRATVPGITSTTVRLGCMGAFL